MADKTVVLRSNDGSKVQVKYVEMEDGTYAQASAPAPGIEGASASGGYFAITPNDSADLASPAQWIYCPTGGELRIAGPDGTPQTFSVAAQGVVDLTPIPAHRVYSAGTTITGLIGGKLS